MKDPIKDFVDTKKKLEKKYPEYTVEITDTTCKCICHFRHETTAEAHQSRCLHCL